MSTRLPASVVGVACWAACVGCAPSHATTPPAPSSAAEPEPVRVVRRALGDRAMLDWTALQVAVTASAMDPMWKGDNKPLEQQAMSAIDARIGAVVAQVMVDSRQRLVDVRPRVATEAATGWAIAEGRYYANGAVELVGRVDLQPLLSLWSSQRSAVMPSSSGLAIPSGPDPEPAKRGEPLDAAHILGSSGPTGVVIDARGLGVEPVYAPRVVDKAGAELFTGVLWRDAAYDHPPVVWVADPVHPAAQVAGADPVFLVAASGGLGEVVLDDAEAARFRAELSPTRAIGEGAVVIVVDP